MIKKLILLVSLVTLSTAAVQEIILHENNNHVVDNSYTFRKGVPDTSIFPFQNVVQFCHTYAMAMYTAINYDGTSTGIKHTTPGCNPFNHTQFKSFRFYGSTDPTVDGVSLYPLPDFVGAETFVDHSPFVVATDSIKSLAYTGKSAWTVFETHNFGGNTACLPAPTSGTTQIFANLSSLNIATVGSLFKGCVPFVTEEIREAMRRQVREMNMQTMDH